MKVTVGGVVCAHAWSGMAIRAMAEEIEEYDSCQDLQLRKHFSFVIGHFFVIKADSGLRSATHEFVFPACAK